MKPKAALKHMVGELPMTAEVYWQLYQQGKPLNRSFTFRHVQRWLPEWRAAATQAAQSQLPGSIPPRRVLIFTTLRYWIEHAVLLGMTLAGQRHTVSLAYLPYPNWRMPLNRFDLRLHNQYALRMLQGAQPLLRPIPLFDLPAYRKPSLPAALEKTLAEVALRDAQYTLQVENVELKGAGEPAQLYRLRLERDRQAASAALAWLQSQPPEQRPEVILTPNGSILEMGAIYQAARLLDIPVVTYEFGEQHGRIWLAHNAEVMRQETDDLWAACKNVPLNDGQWERLRTLYAARQHGRLWQNFTRMWQDLPGQGGEQVRQALGLDNRPVVLLAANVIGDSLTLGRQVFSQSMTEWLERSVQTFAARPDVQLVVRVHPGERWIAGPSVAEVVRRAIPVLSEHIHIVEAVDAVNTYDLVEIADLGLAYTTTVGMEMAMSGVPTIIVGQTHYRGKGFTLDPASWQEYQQTLEQVLQNPAAHRLNRQQVELAWQYAYRFFFNYPFSFPWHLLNFWNEMEDWPMQRVLSAEGQAEFGPAFRYLAGEPIDWLAAARQDTHLDDAVFATPQPSSTRLPQEDAATN